ANSAGRARFLTADLLPRLEGELPRAGTPYGRCMMGSSFGAVASLSVAYRHPGVYGSLLLQSGSFVFTDIGNDHGGGPVFEPVVRFVNRFRAAPRRVADRLFVSCGVYEPLIVRNRSMVPVFEAAGMTVRYVEARDGHSWENWRDRLRDGLSWIFPGPQEVVPAIHADLGGQAIDVITTGASIGAFNAVAVLCRYPDVFGAAIGMSGSYRIERFYDEAWSQDLYYSAPMQFLPGLDGAQLDRLRQRQVILASGEGEWEDVGSSWQMAAALGDKGVPNRVDNWGPQWDHQWHT